MTEFTLIAVVMTVIGLGWLLLPMLRSRRRGDIDRKRVNIGVLRDQLRELDADHQRGTVLPEQYTELRAELERRLIDETQAIEADAPVAAGASRGVKTSAAVVAVALPILAGVLYWRLGDYSALQIDQMVGQVNPDHGMSNQQITDLTKALEDRLAREPENPMGWATLARTYYSQRDFDKAARAYGKLADLVPQDAAVLADYADALAMTQGRKIEGRPLELVNKALAIEPTQWKALAMAGTAAFGRKDYKGAVTYWETLARTLPADSPMVAQIGNSIAEARQLGGMKPAQPGALVPPVAQAGAGKSAGAKGDTGKSNAGKADAGKAAAAASVSGTVNLSPELRAKVAPTDAVFIFARPAEGPRMPLALTQVQVKDLPARFSLDDSMAMSPNFRLSGYEQVIVGARVSKTGRPMPAPGDLEGLSAAIKVGSGNVAVTIDKVLP